MDDTVISLPTADAVVAAVVDGVGADAAASAPPDLVDRVHRMLTDHLHLDAATPDTDIVDNGALDSFAMVEVLVALEEHFGVEVDVDELDVDDFRCARSIATLIAAHSR